MMVQSNLLIKLSCKQLWLERVTGSCRDGVCDIIWNLLKIKLNFNKTYIYYNLALYIL